MWAAGPDGPRLMAERPWWDWGLHLRADLGPGRAPGRVLPVIVSDAATNALRNPLAVWKVAEIARTADLRPELEELPRCWPPGGRALGPTGPRHPSGVPRRAPSLSLVFGDVEVRTVEGSHSWLMTDPSAFTEYSSPTSWPDAP